MLASHIIFTAHGFWLPNGPRGSWSTYIRNYELYLAAGCATTIATRQSVAHTDHDRSARLNVKATLKYPPVRLTSGQARHAVNAFRRATGESSYRIHALAVLPDHVHVVVARHANSPARIVGHWKARCTQALLAADVHPLAAHRRPNGRVPEFWAHRAWKVFLDTPDDVRRAVAYVDANPGKAGLRRQRYTFLTPFVETATG